eukprot:scaffold146605_cov22-Tisochrysis_lutea.AAC.1
METNPRADLGVQNAKEDHTMSLFMKKCVHLHSIRMQKMSKSRKYTTMSPNDFQKKQTGPPAKRPTASLFTRKRSP